MDGQCMLTISWQSSKIGSLCNMNYQKIDFCNMNNGDGLRVVIWVSGCNHHCKGCFNPETWDCECGLPLGVEEINKILHYLRQNWCSGITLTGGDPLFSQNRNDVLALCYILKQNYPEKTIWLYTGYTLDQIKENNDMSKILRFVDVLCDGPFIEEQKSPDKPWVGSENQQVIYLGKDDKL